MFSLEIYLIIIFVVLNKSDLCIFQAGDGENLRHIETVDLHNDGSGLGFGIVGGRSTGVIVKTILPGGVADRVCIEFSFKIFLKGSLSVRM